MRAARDAGDLPVSTARCVKVKEHTEICTHRSRRLVTSAPRAMFLGLLCVAPGGLTENTHRFDAQHRLIDPDESSAAATGIRDEEPPRRDRTAWAAAKVLRTPAATAPAPHSKTPRETPLVGQDKNEYNPMNQYSQLIGA